MDPVPLLTAAVLGFVHALEVDHMLAVTSFVSRRPALTTALRFGFRWGVGHSIAVLLAGGLLLATGLRLSGRFDQLAEATVGLMLIGLGVWTLRSTRNLHLHPPAEHGDHAHLHLHGQGASRHRHHHEAEAPRSHSHGVTLVGLMHGLAGTSAVVALVPVTLVDQVSVGVWYLLAFGAGVTAAMTLFAGAVGAAGILVGAGWILRALTG